MRAFQIAALVETAVRDERERGIIRSKALEDAARQALETLENHVMQRTYADGIRISNTTLALRAALAEPVLQTCNCRWDGEVQVQQCTLHEAHVDAIHEWAERAKTAEKKLAALAEPEERQTITPKELAASLKRGEKWRVADEIGGE